MLINNLLHVSPLLYDFWAECLHTLRAKIFNLCAVWVAVKTEIIEENVDLEVSIQYFALVLADVFRGELHLASANVISILNESSIEHNSANHRLTEPLVVEDNLSVSTHRK